MITDNKNGFVLVTSILLLTSLLVAGSYLISISNSEIKITKANSIATKTYYLAETGINEMIWKIQNDSSMRTAFLNGTLSSANDISRTNIFNDLNAGYQVTAINTVTAEAQIIATSTYQLGNSVSQRVVKSYISRATGDNQEWDFSTFAGGRGSQQNGNFRFNGSGTVLISTGGRLHANQEFKVKNAEVIVNDGAVTSSNVINVVSGGRLTLNNSYQDAPTTTIEMLQIDFYSDDPYSWKNRATVTYSEDDFEDLPSNTTLNGIIYVIGDAEIEDKNFTINGVLVAEEKIEITTSGQIITVNADPSYGGGLLAKDDIDITTSGGTVTVNGLIYSADDLDITSSGTNFTVNGSITGFDAQITASGTSIILNHTPENFNAVINPIYNPSSPLIQIDHWEEQY